MSEVSHAGLCDVTRFSGESANCPVPFPKWPARVSTPQIYNSFPGLGVRPERTEKEKGKKTRTDRSASLLCCTLQATQLRYVTVYRQCHAHTPMSPSPCNQTVGNDNVCSEKCPTQSRVASDIPIDECGPDCNFLATLLVTVTDRTDLHTRRETGSQGPGYGRP